MNPLSTFYRQETEAQKDELPAHLSTSAQHIMNGKQMVSAPSAWTSHNRLETALLQVARSWEMPARRETDGMCPGAPHLLPLPNPARPAVLGKGQPGHQEHCGRDRKGKIRETLLSQPPANNFLASSWFSRQSWAQKVGLGESRARATGPLLSFGPITET